MIRRQFQNFIDWIWYLCNFFILTWIWRLWFIFILIFIIYIIRGTISNKLEYLQIQQRFFMKRALYFFKKIILSCNSRAHLITKIIHETKFIVLIKQHHSKMNWFKYLLKNWLMLTSFDFLSFFSLRFVIVFR